VFAALTNDSQINRYKGNATRKRDCRPEEHTIIYRNGYQEPQLLEGESDLLKSLIEVNRPDSKPVDIALCIDFGRVYTVEHHGARVKNLGMVHQEDMATLYSHFTQVLDSGAAHL
jgi:hypothetical protein